MRWLALLFAAAVAGISIAATLRPDLFSFVRSLPGQDKLGHFLLMGTLGGLAVLGFSGWRPGGRRLGALRCIVLVLIFVTTEEVLQLAASSRSFSLSDLVASYAGVAVFGGAAAWVVRSGDEGDGGDGGDGGEGGETGSGGEAPPQKEGGQGLLPQQAPGLPR